MRFIDSIRRSIRSLMSAKVRTLLTAFAIAVGAFALSLTLAATNGANTYADSIVTSNFDPSELVVSASDELFGAADTSKPKEYNQNFTSVTLPTGASSQTETLDDNDIKTLQSIAGVESVRTASTVGLTYITRDGQRKYNATAQAYSNYTAPDLLAGTIAPGLGDDSLILPEGFLWSFGFDSADEAVGKKVRIAVQQQVDQASLLASFLSGDGPTDLSSLPSQDTIVETEFTIAAVGKKPSLLVQPGAELYVIVNEQTLTRLRDIATKGTTSFHKYLSVNVKVANGTDQGKLTAVQKLVKQRGYAAQSVIDTQKTITQVLAVLQGIVLVFGLIAVIASVFGVVNTMYISVLQRTREIGLMKALGMHKSNINQLFLFEAGLIGLLGGAIGSFTAVIAGTLLNPTISTALELGDTQMLEFHSDQVGLLLLALVIVAMLAGYLPARKAARLDPIEALRTE